MIYIFDTSHETQTDHNFYNFFRKTILKYNIEIVAEEADNNNSFNSLVTIAYKNRLKYGLKYINIENKNYQVDMKSLAGQFFPSLQSLQKAHFALLKTKFNKRERYWRKKILPYKNENILLICGAEHLKSFIKKLNQFNICFKRLDSFMIVDNKIIPNKLFNRYLNK